MDYQNLAAALVLDKGGHDVFRYFRHGRANSTNGETSDNFSPLTQVVMRPILALNSILFQF